LALVGIVPALALTWNEPPDVVAEANRIYVFERLPHHLALLSLPADETTHRLLRHGALLLVLWILARLVCGRAGSIVDRQTPPIDAAGLRSMFHFAVGGAILAGVGLIIELTLAQEPIAAARLLRYYWCRLTDFSAPLAAALLASAVIVVAIECRGRWAVWALAAAIALAGGHITGRVMARLVDPTPPGDRRMRDPAAWTDACQWIIGNTEADARFLTPRLSHTFKWQTGRPEVVTRKDIPQDAAGIIEWHRRYRDVYYGGNDDRAAEPAASLGHLGTERVVQLARRYGATYVITDRRRPLWLPVVYPTQHDLNFEYVVYRIPDDAPADPVARDGE
jgi:hypothetical protein